MMKRILLGFAALLMVLHVDAQRTCGTMDVHNRLLQTDPQYATNRAAIEQFTQNYAASGAATRPQRSVITIPVVVHVVYYNAAGNLSDAQVISQITRLNLDYHKLNADTALVPAVWDSLIADCNIQFCLAQRDPNGLPTNGIVRKSTTVTSWGTNDAVKYSAQGGDDAWPRDSYLNLWACDLGGGLLGYSQFPGGPAATDGCIILNSAFGDTGTVTVPYNKGRTVTHEVGHWLNLYHTWGDDNGACTGSDSVADTPNSGNATYGAPTFPLLDNCATVAPGVMFMDYMDYTDDGSMYMFTKGQNVRIQANFANGGPRAPILNSLGCVAPGGGPFAGFTADKLNICVGQQVQFTDASFDTPTVYHWIFAGGTPDTSNLQNPGPVTYNTPGVYTVSLTVTKDTSSNTKTMTNYITVKGTTPLPLSEGFEGSTFPPTGWSIVNPDNLTAWAQSTGAGGFGLSSASAYLDNFTQANIRGQFDYLYTPVMDFSSGITASSTLKFDYAYAQKRTTSRDSLFVEYSTDCGATWTTVWANGSTGMATTTTLYGTSVYVPGATEWRRDSSISLASLAGQSAVQFAFVNKSNHGNAIYLDNINIEGVNSTTAIADLNTSMKVSIVPNPAKDICAVHIDMDQPRQTEVSLYDVIGQRVWVRDMGVVRNAAEPVSLAALATGVYIVKVKAGDKSYTTRLVKQ